MIALPAGVNTVPPPPLPPAAVSTTGAPRPLFRSSTSSQVRRYDIRNARPAAEIEPDRPISSRTAIFPGPMRSPLARSIRIFRRSPAVPDASDFSFFFGMTRYQNTARAQDQSLGTGFPWSPDGAISAGIYRG